MYARMYVCTYRVRQKLVHLGFLNWIPPPPEQFFAVSPESTRDKNGYTVEVV